MLGQHSLFRAAGALAAYASERQELLARNVANADTPGYKARELRPFDLVSFTSTGETLFATRAGHVMARVSDANFTTAEIEEGASSPNGNAVSLEREMVRSADISRQHELAISVYSSALNILRTSLGRG